MYYTVRRAGVRASRWLRMLTHAAPTWARAFPPAPGSEVLPMVHVETRVQSSLHLDNMCRDAANFERRPAAYVGQPPRSARAVQSRMLRRPPGSGGQRMHQGQPCRQLVPRTCGRLRGALRSQGRSVDDETTAAAGAGMGCHRGRSCQPTGKPAACFKLTRSMLGKVAITSRNSAGQLVAGFARRSR